MDVEEDLIYNLKKAATLRRFLTENEEQFFSKTVGEVIKESLESKKLTKAKVAERAGTSWVYLYQILTGKRNPSRNRILAIGLAMGCDLREMQALLHDCGFAELDERRRRDAIIKQ